VLRSAVVGQGGNERDIHDKGKPGTDFAQGERERLRLRHRASDARGRESGREPPQPEPIAPDRYFNALG
jgi:hypothetical protein